MNTALSALRKTLLVTTALILVFISKHASAQIDEDQLGAWYMYFWNTRFDDSNFGLQGDIQHRNWDLGETWNNCLLEVEQPIHRTTVIFYTRLG